MSRTSDDFTADSHCEHPNEWQYLYASMYIREGTPQYLKILTLVIYAVNAIRTGLQCLVKG